MSDEFVNAENAPVSLTNSAVVWFISIASLKVKTTDSVVETPDEPVGGAVETMIGWAIAVAAHSSDANQRLRDKTRNRDSSIEQLNSASS